MPNESLISVLTITYNHEEFIGKAVQSIFEQKSKFDIELVIANDCSTDSTDLEIKKALSAVPDHFDFKYILRERNLGMNENFIEALKHCTGKYIAICEGDDYWTDPFKLEKQVDFLEKNQKFSMICHDALVIDGIKGLSRPFFNSYHQKQVCSLPDTLNIHFCPAASIVFRSQAILPLGNLQVGATLSDQFLVQMLSLKGLVYRMKEVMCVYRRHSGGMSHIAEGYRISALSDRIVTYKYLIKISGRRYRKIIALEIWLVKIRIGLIKHESLPVTVFLKAIRKILIYFKNFLARKALSPSFSE